MRGSKDPSCANKMLGFRCKHKYVFKTSWPHEYTLVQFYLYISYVLLSNDDLQLSILKKNGSGHNWKKITFEKVFLPNYNEQPERENNNGFRKGNEIVLVGY